MELLEDRTVPTVLEIAPTDRLASHFQPNHHWLTNASGGFLTGPNAGQPLDIALGYLNSHATDLGLTLSDLAQLIVTDMYADADVGVTHIYLRQAANGLQVENANFSIHIASQGEVITVGGGFVANLSGIVGTTIAPDVTAQQAVLYAASHLGSMGLG